MRPCCSPAMAGPDPEGTGSLARAGFRVRLHSVWPRRFRGGVGAGVRRHDAGRRWRPPRSSMRHDRPSRESDADQDASPICPVTIESFLTLRARLRGAIRRAGLNRPDLLKATVVWNVEEGLRLTGGSAEQSERSATTFGSRSPA